MMLGIEFLMTVGDAIALTAFAVLFGILLVMLAIEGLCRLWEWTKEKAYRIWWKITN